ncbi:MAG: hypothetical protein R2795_11690 [Saprospiraceae bacterium]
MLKDSSGPKYNAGDHTHLNDAAHRILFDRVRKAFDLPDDPLAPKSNRPAILATSQPIRGLSLKT